MKTKQYRLAARASLISLGLTFTAWSQVALTIDNPGFETDALPDAAEVEPATSWTSGYYDTGNTVWADFSSGVFGAINPDAAYGFGGVAFAGNNIGWAQSFADYDQGARQILSHALSEHAVYDLSVRVGNPGAFNTGKTVGSYRIELVANDVILASSTGAAPAADTWTEATLSFNYDASPEPTALGSPVEIRLFAVDNGQTGWELAFDQVSLSLTLTSPSANAGGPYNVPSAGSLSLDGSGSLPSTGATITAYDWDLNNDDIFGDVTGANPGAISYSDLKTSWGMNDGPNTIKLRVTDTTAATSITTTTVNLLPPIGCQVGVLDVINANGGINPATGLAWAAGDKYRLVFVTGQTTVCTSTDIKTYNNFVQGLAAASTTYPKLGNGLWKVVGTTATVAARDNTGTNPDLNGTGEPILRMDGTFVIANNYADLWDGINNSHEAGQNYLTVHLDENGVEQTDERVRTGTTGNGTAPGDGRVLGGSGEAPPRVQTGRNFAPDFYGGLGGFNWMQDWSEEASSAGRVYAMSEPLTVVNLTDATAPTLVSITDDKSGAPVSVPETVVYTVTFSEPMSAGSVNVSDFENGSTAAVTIDSVSPTADPAVYQVSVTTAGSGDLQLRIKADATLADLTGNLLDATTPLLDDTIIAVGQDLTPPTMVSITDNVSGGPVTATKLSTPQYTVTFSEPINAATVGTDDFENGSTAPVTINSVSATGNPAVFTVVVTTSGPGDLVLQIKQGADIKDLADNALNTASPLPDDTTITVNPPPALAGQLGVLDVVNANGGINPATGLAWAAGDQYRLVFLTSATTDASSSDINTYNAFVQGVAAASTTYPNLGNAQWKIVGSTATVDARDNTGTNPDLNGTGVAVFLMNGRTAAANNNGDIWNGINVAVGLNENGTAESEDRAFTGTLPNGTKVTGTGDQPLGSFGEGLGNIRTGNSASTGGGWMTNFNIAYTTQQKVFAMSDLLTVVSTAGGGGYQDWANNNVGGAGINVDSNGDGVENGIAYFYNNGGIITLPGVVGGAVTWTNGGNIPASGYGTQFRVETSTDLVTWTPVDVGDLTANTDGPAGSLTYTLPPGVIGGRIFVRLAVNPD